MSLGTLLTDNVLLSYGPLMTQVLCFINEPMSQDERLLLAFWTITRQGY